jgi:hypothetical protein
MTASVIRAVSAATAQILEIPIVVIAAWVTFLQKALVKKSSHVIWG